MQGNKQFTPKIYYTLSLPDMVPAGNYYRKLDAELDLSWVRQATARFYSNEGRPGIDPIVFMKVLLVGYLNNICSDRRLMEVCSNQLDLRLFLGYDLDEALPCHSTLSRTRALWGEEVFRQLFVQVLGLCVHKGMVRGKRQAIDSAPIKANASMDALQEKEVAEDAEAYTEELNEGSEFKLDLTKGLPRQPAPCVPIEEDRTKGKRDRYGNFIKQKGVSNKTHHSPVDPESRLSVKPGKPLNLNYHGQASVDDAHHVITGALANLADRRDSDVLEEVVDQTVSNLRQCDLTVEEVLADGSYSSGKALGSCIDRNITAYIPNNGPYKPYRKGFLYNQQKNRYECQRGNRALLPYKNTVKNHGNYEVHVYRSSAKDCRDCPFSAGCLGKNKSKKLTHTVDKPLYDEMHLRMMAGKGRRLMRRRSATVEPVLGSLLNFFGMRRVNTRGLAGANKHVLLAATCYNLKKYLKFLPRTGRVCTRSMETLLKGAFTPLMTSFYDFWRLVTAGIRHLLNGRPIIQTNLATNQG